MRRLFIHAGQPKTGTSALQNFLYSHRAELMRSGYQCPEAGLGQGGGHRLLVCDLLGKPLPPSRRGCAERAREELSGGPAPNAVVSAEALWLELSRGLDNAVIRFFRELGFELNIIAYVRDPVELCNSGYAQNVKSYKKSITQQVWVEDFLKSYPRLLDRWTRLIESGEAPVVVRPYTKAVRKDGIARDFLSAVGVDGPGLDAFEPDKRVNTGIGPIELAVLLELIHRFDVRSSAMVRGQIGTVRRRVREVIRSEGPEPSYRGLDAAQAREVQRRTEDARQRFAQAAWGKAWEECVPPTEADWVPNRFDRRTADPDAVARFERTLDAAMAAARSTIQGPGFDRIKQRAIAKNAGRAEGKAPAGNAEPTSGSAG